MLVSTATTLEELRSEIAELILMRCVQVDAHPILHKNKRDYQMHQYAGQVLRELAETIKAIKIGL